METITIISEPMSPSSPVAEVAEGACFLCTAEYQLLESCNKHACEHCKRTICAQHIVTRRIDAAYKATICLKCYKRTYRSACPLRERSEQLRGNRREERRLTKALLGQQEILEGSKSRRALGRLSHSPEVCVGKIAQEKERRGKIDIRIIELKALIQAQVHKNESLRICKKREICLYREHEIEPLKAEITQIRCEIRHNLVVLRQQLPFSALPELLCVPCLRHFPHSFPVKPASSPRHRATPPATPSTVATPTTQSCVSNCHLM